MQEQAGTKKMARERRKRLGRSVGPEQGLLRLMFLARLCLGGVKGGWRRMVSSRRLRFPCVLGTFFSQPPRLHRAHGVIRRPGHAGNLYVHSDVTPYYAGDFKPARTRWPRGGEQGRALNGRPLECHGMQAAVGSLKILRTPLPHREWQARLTVIHRRVTEAWCRTLTHALHGPHDLSYLQAWLKNSSSHWSYIPSFIVFYHLHVEPPVRAARFFSRMRYVKNVIQSSVGSEAGALIAAQDRAPTSLRTRMSTRRALEAIVF